jgi:uncharacterized RDD family membrane protein YckC
MSSSAAPEQEYAGQRLGLPPEGSRAVASWGRRIAALLIDWGASWLVAVAVFGSDLTEPPTTWIDLFAVPLIAVGQTVLFLLLLAGSFGQVLLRVAVVRLDGRRLNPWQALVRTVLVYLVIPPVVFNRDNRGLHDLAVGTVAINR